MHFKKSMSTKLNLYVLTKVADPDGVFPDPDPTFEKQPGSTPDPIIEKNRIQIIHNKIQLLFFYFENKNDILILYYHLGQ